MFYKKIVLRNFATFTGKHLCQSLFFNKVGGLRTLAQVFSCEFCEISRSTFFTKYLRRVLLYIAYYWDSQCQINLNVRKNALNSAIAFLILKSIRPQAYNFIKKETLPQVFSSEFCKISKNTFSYRTLPMAASEIFITSKNFPLRLTTAQLFNLIR